MKVAVELSPMTYTIGAVEQRESEGTIELGALHRFDCCLTRCGDPLVT